MRLFIIFILSVITIFANTLDDISQTQAKQEEDRLKFIESQKESSNIILTPKKIKFQPLFQTKNPALLLMKFY